jgi:hypothetical protein
MFNDVKQLYLDFRVKVRLQSWDSISYEITSRGDDIITRNNFDNLTCRLVRTVYNQLKFESEEKFTSDD